MARKSIEGNKITLKRQQGESEESWQKRVGELVQDAAPREMSDPHEIKLRWFGRDKVTAWQMLPGEISTMKKVA